MGGFQEQPLSNGVTTMARHLTIEERETIARMKNKRRTTTEIAARLGRAYSTIWRELRRNRSRNRYWAMAARKKADKRQRRPRIGKL